MQLLITSPVYLESSKYRMVADSKGEQQPLVDENKSIVIDGGDGTQVSKNLSNINRILVIYYRIINYKNFFFKKGLFRPFFIIKIP